MLLPAMIFLGAAVLLLAVLFATGRLRAWLWHAIARGSGALTVAGIVIGIAVVFFFERRVPAVPPRLLPQGNFSFDPRTQRLTQLFSEPF